MKKDIELSFNHLVENILNDCKVLLVSKSHDYAENDNRYSNFEQAGNMAGISPEQSILNLVGIKLARIKQLITTDKQAKNESIEDSIKDAINYLLLLNGKLKGIK